MSKFSIKTTGILSAVVFTLFAATAGIKLSLPESRPQACADYNPLPIIQEDNAAAALYKNNGEEYNPSFSPDNFIPAKETQAQQTQRKMVVPGGTPFGIKMFTKGVMIVGMSDIQSGIENINPAKIAGLKIGDILLSLDGKELTCNEDVAKFISEAEGKSVNISFLRGEVEKEAVLSPVKTEYDQKLRAGIWVRDSSAGIGTLTYYHPDTMTFAGLGHGVCDIDTGKIMPLSKGEIVDVNISGINAGQSGKPGELRGSFLNDNIIGILKSNNEMGVFGHLNHSNIFGSAIPMAEKHEIQAGSATILSTVSGNKPREFKIEIEKINYMDTFGTKNMIIKVTDPALLNCTGGIVQGMSGSPIIQNGMLAGAVTHVFVNDPTRGYAVFAENMEKQIPAI